MVAGRALFAEHKKQFDLYEKALANADKAQTLSDQEIDALHVERDRLRQALADEKQALDLKDKALQAYKKDLAKMTKSRNFWKAIAKYSSMVTLAAVATAAVVILKE